MIDRVDVDLELALGVAHGLGETVASLSPVLALLTRAEGDANAAGAAARSGGDLIRTARAQIASVRHDRDTLSLELQQRARAIEVDQHDGPRNGGPTLLDRLGSLA